MFVPRLWRSDSPGPPYVISSLSSWLRAAQPSLALLTIEFNHHLPCTKIPYSLAHPSLALLTIQSSSPLHRDPTFFAAELIIVSYRTPHPLGAGHEPFTASTKRTKEVKSCTPNH